MSEDQKVSKNFIDNIKNWLAIDDVVLKLTEEISKRRNEIKKLNADKQQFESSIIDELDKIQTNVVAVSDGKIRKSVRKITKPLNKEDIRKTIFEFTKDEQKSLDITDQMMKNRKTVEKINLKRKSNE